MASILIDRNFSPNLRSYEYTEWNPQWKDVSKWIQNTQQTDSLYLDSIRQVDNLHLLNTVEVEKSSIEATRSQRRTTI